MLVVFDKDKTLVGPREGPPANSTRPQQPLPGRTAGRGGANQIERR